MKWKTELWMLTVCIFFTASSYTMLVPFLPVYLLELGVAEENVPMWSGVVFSVSFFIGAVMAPIWGKLADKKGKRVMAIRAACGLSVVYFLGGIVTDVYQLFGMRLLQGFANGFVPAAMAIVSSNVPREKLGESLGVLQTGQITGAVVGPLIGGLLSQWIGMRMSFFLAGTFLAFVSLVVIFYLREPPKVADAHDGSSLWDDVLHAWQNKTLVEMLLMVMFLQIATMILQPVVTLYIGYLQGGMEQAAFYSGLIFSLAGLAGALVTPLWGRFGQRSGYYKAIMLAFAGSGLFNCLQYLPENVAGFAALQFGFGLFIVGVSPAVSALTVICTEASFRGRVFGLSTTAHQIGSMLGPLIGGFLSSYFGIKAVFVFTGIFLIVVSLYVYRHHFQTITGR